MKSSQSLTGVYLGNKRAAFGTGAELINGNMMWAEQPSGHESPPLLLENPSPPQFRQFATTLRSSLFRRYSIVMRYRKISSCNAPGSIYRPGNK